MPKKNNLSPHTGKPRSVRFSPVMDAAILRLAEMEFRTPTDIIRLAVMELLKARGVEVA